VLFGFDFDCSSNVSNAYIPQSIQQQTLLFALLHSSHFTNNHRMGIREESHDLEDPEAVPPHIVAGMKRVFDEKWVESEGDIHTSTIAGNLG